MRSLLIAVCICFVALAAFAQTDRGTITGTISDPAKAVVPNAPVEVKNTVTGATYQAGSSGTGNFTMAELPAGTYELSVTVSGFKKFVRPGIVVPVAQTVRVDVALEVGSNTETVTITAEAPLLKTESGELSHNVGFDRVDNLALFTTNGTGAGAIGNVRDPLSVLNLLPGAQQSTDNSLSINGMPSSSHTIRIEGQDATNGMWRQLNQATQASVDAIQEVSVQTSNFSAEYGQAGGGYLNYTMRSGTNQFHGGASDIIVNEAFNAGTPFTSDGNGHLIRNAVRRNNYGLNLGGPVWIPKVYNGHDKTFFFFNFEQFRETQVTRNGIATVPTQAYRDGDFSGAAVFPIGPDPAGNLAFLNEVFDPRTNHTAPNGQIVRDPFPGGKIPLSLQDPVAAKLQALLPLPNIPGAELNNYAIPAYSNFRHTTIPSVKIDHQISSTIKVSGFFSQTHTTSPNSNGFSAALSPVAPTDDRSSTYRVNYDQSFTPTLLFHFGGGLLYFTHPTLVPQNYDQGQLWAPNQQFAANHMMPSTGGLFNFFTGGVSLGAGFFAPSIGAPFSVPTLKDIKPTANTSLTWVRGNHTYKAGAEMVIEGFPQFSQWRANGSYNFSGIETSNPWENGQTGFFTTGFPYASFWMGRTDSLQVSALNNSRLGNHSLGFFVQDNWKVTRKLTLDYGLRYDYVTLLKEQYGRMQNAAFNTPNPVAGDRLGNVIYEATCHCSFNHNYPFAFGPRLGLAYQLTPKTVFRAGVGVNYSTSPNNAFLSYSVADFYTVGAQSYGESAIQVAQGNPYAPGNAFGNPTISFPDFTRHYPLEVAPGVRPPAAPFISIDRNAGRPPRILTWSIGLQREIARNLVVEASYVGNRGAWWTAPTLAGINYNAQTPQGLMTQRQYGSTTGVDVTNPTDANLLTTPISSPQVIARFPGLANPNNVYPGFPANQPLIAALVPYPQWFGGIPPFLGPPLGDTWYDSLQIKGTKRLSHGLDAQVAFTWQKILDNGAGADTSYFTPSEPIINDVFNTKQNKQFSAFDRPLVLVISFNYTTPGFKSDNKGLKAASWIARDWTIGGVLRYQSGVLIQTPPSSNNLTTQLGRGPSNNPAQWGGGNTLENVVAGQNPLAVDPNCHCFDPQRTLVLNPKAWTDAAPGQWGTSAAYYDGYRWQRQPAESLSVGRLFRIAKEGRVTLQIRAEFQNIFNRVALTPPAVGGLFGFYTNSLTPPGCANEPPGFPCKAGDIYNAGYGYVNMIPGGQTYVETPRSGQIVAKFVF
jgi:hypothetical protein